MKRFVSLCLALLLLFALTGCSTFRMMISNSKYHPANQVTIPSNTLAQLRFDEASYPLTEAESKKVRQILTGAEYCEDGAGCPFNEDRSITFGDQIFAISADDCYTFKNLSQEKYYEISQKDRAYILSLFEKYAGRFP